MEGPRPPFEHELDSFVKFLTSQLRPEAAWPINEEYPLAIHDSNLNNIRVIREGNSYLSAAVMKPLVIKTVAGIFKVAAVGSVVTEAAHRNLGLSRQVLEDALSAAQSHGCDFALLWTNLFDFYRKIGFEMAGSEIALTLMTVWPDEPHALRFMKGPNVDAEAMLRIYSQHTTGTIRTAEDIRKFLRIPNSNVYTAWDHEGRLHAYAVEGKGLDLNGYIHEWGGGVSKLLPLLRHMRIEQDRPLTLISPPQASNLIKTLKERGATAHEGILGMIRLLNANNVLLKAKKYTRALGYEGVCLESRDEKFYFGFKDHIYSTDSSSDIIRLLFGPQKPSQIHNFDSSVKEVFDAIFPLPLWVWGWDSV